MSNAEQEIVRPYPEYKPSGSQWIGEIPSHWRSTAIKRVSQTGSGGTPPTGQQEYYGEGIPWVTSSELREQTITSTTETISERAISEIASLKLHSKGSVVIAMYGATIGRLGILGTPATVNQACCACKASQHINSNFLYHWLLANKDNLSALGQGGGQPNLSQEIIREFPIVLPPLEEQTAIVRFLDHADEQIQRYIAGKERLIALLEEERQAVIHQAVTRGLDPNVKLKPSGVEWLGDVPEHWETCRLRNVVSEVTTGSRGWSSYASDSGPLFMRVANLNRGSLQLRFDDVVRLNLPDTSEVSRTRIWAGDLLVSVTAFIGSVGIASKELGEAYVSQHVARCRPHTGLSSQWLGYVLLSQVGQTHGQMSLYGGTKDGLSLDDVKNYPILLPPRAEQNDIVEYLTKISVDNAAVIDQARRQVDLMNEYRTRLIADVVTGQLDVRETAAELPNLEPAEIID